MGNHSFNAGDYTGTRSADIQTRENFTSDRNYYGRNGAGEGLSTSGYPARGKDTLENRSSAYEPTSPMFNQMGSKSQYRDLVGKTDLDKYKVTTPSIPQRQPFGSMGNIPPANFNLTQ